MKVQLFLLFPVLIGLCNSAITFSNSLTSNAVLQRAPQQSNIFGFSTPNTQVNVTFQSEIFSGFADSNGKWVVALPPTPAGGPYNITATDNLGKSILLENVLFGDVYLCVGELNMNYQAQFAYNWEELLNSSSSFGGQIRFLSIADSAPTTLQKDITTEGWFIPELDINRFRTFPAVCAFTANFTLASQQVPLGFMRAAWDGSMIEHWNIKNGDNCNFNFNDGGLLWNGMIAPLEGWRMRGVVWYQGESNAIAVYRYGCQLKSLISNWRNLFQNPGLVWIGIQLHSFFQDENNDFNANQLMRSIQSQVYTNDSNSFMVVTYDLGDPTSPFGNLRPRYKREIGYRVAQVIKKRVYGMEEEVDEGPVIQSWNSSVVGISPFPQVARIQVFLSDKTGTKISYNAQGKCPSGNAYVCGNPLQVRVGKDQWLNSFDISINGSVITFYVNHPQGVQITDLRYGYSQYLNYNFKNKDGFPLAVFNSFNEFPSAPSFPSRYNIHCWNSNFRLVPVGTATRVLNYQGHKWQFIPNESDPTLFYIQSQNGNYLTFGSSTCSNSDVVLKGMEGTSQQQWRIISNGFREEVYYISNKFCNTFSLDNFLRDDVSVASTNNAYWYGQFWTFSQNYDEVLNTEITLGCSLSFKDEIMEGLRKSGVNTNLTIIVTEDCAVNADISFDYAISHLRIIGRKKDSNERVRLTNVRFLSFQVTKSISFENLSIRTTSPTQGIVFQVNTAPAVERIRVTDVDYSNNYNFVQNFVALVALDIQVRNVHVFNSTFIGNAAIFVAGMGGRQLESSFLVTDSLFEWNYHQGTSAIFIISELKEAIVTNCRFENQWQVGQGTHGVDLLQRYRSLAFVWDNNRSFNETSGNEGSTVTIHTNTLNATISNSSWNVTSGYASSSFRTFDFGEPSLQIQQIRIYNCQFLNGVTGDFGSVSTNLGCFVKKYVIENCLFSGHYFGSHGNVFSAMGPIEDFQLINSTVENSSAGISSMQLSFAPISTKIISSKFINIHRRTDIEQDHYGSAISIIEDYFAGTVENVEIFDCQFLNSSSVFGDLVFFVGMNFNKILIDSCEFSGGFAAPGSMIHGGITVYSSVNQLTVQNVNFFQNAFALGGINIFTEVKQLGTVRIINNTFKNNSASEGGMIAVGQSSTANRLVIMNNFFQFNKGRKTGGILLDGPVSNVMIVNNVMLDNNAVVQGGGMTVSSRTQMYSFNMTNNTISRNFATSNGGGISFAGGINGYAIIYNLTTNQNKVNNIGGSFYLSPANSNFNMEIRNWTSKNNVAAESGGSLYLANEFNFFHVIDFEMEGNQGGTGGAASLFGFGKEISFQRGKMNNSTGSAIYIPSSFLSENVLMENVEMKGNKGTLGSHINLRGAASNFVVRQCSFSNSNSLDESSISFNELSVVSSITFSQCLFEKNEGLNRGGAIYINSGHLSSLSLLHNRFFKNSANEGAAFYFVGLVDDVLIQDNSFIENTASSSGGAFRFISAPDSFYLFNNSFTANTAKKNGGAFTCEGGSLYSFNNSFLSNKAGEKGGAILIQNPTNDCVMENNEFWKNVGGEGGAIYSSCSSVTQVLLNSSQVNGNIGNVGGGAIQINGSCIFTVESSLLMNNIGLERGGGISMNTGAHLIISQSNISGNIAKLGGGIYSSSSNLTIVGSQVYFNNGTSGGGVYVNNGNTVISSSNFTANTATYRGGSFYLLVSAKRKRQERGETGSTTLNGNKIEKNKGGEGGGMFVENMGEEGQVKVEGNEMKNNWGEVGGGIGLIGKLTLNNNIMMGNQANTNGSGMYIAGDAQLTDSNNSWNGEDVFIKNGVKFSSFQQNNLKCDRGELSFDGEKYFCPLYVDPIHGSTQTDNVINNPVKESNGLSTGAIVGIIVGVVTFFVIAVIVLILVLYRKKKNIAEEKYDFPLMEINYNKKVVIDYNDIGEKTKIGQGAYGVVYRAKWRGIDIAMKQIPNQNLTQKSQLEEFLGEVELLQNLRPHPNVVMFIGITVPPHPFSLITELCENGNLVHFIHKNPELANYEFKRRIVGEIALGMYHLHSENIIHRDLAARNILLTKKLEAKVSDFGLSRQQDKETLEGKTKSDVGPLKWMAPESILNQTYSRKSDVYSFGITVWEIIHEKLPYEDMDLLKAAIAVAQEGKRPPIDAECPKEMVDLMENCWRQDPFLRPQFEDIVSLFSDLEIKPSYEKQLHDDDVDPGSNYQPFARIGSVSK